MGQNRFPLDSEAGLGCAKCRYEVGGCNKCGVAQTFKDGPKPGELIMVKYSTKDAETQKEEIIW